MGPQLILKTNPSPGASAIESSAAPRSPRAPCDFRAGRQVALLRAVPAPPAPVSVCPCVCPCVCLCVRVSVCLCVRVSVCVPVGCGLTAARADHRSLQGQASGGPPALAGRAMPLLCPAVGQPCHPYIGDADAQHCCLWHASMPAHTPCTASHTEKQVLIPR